MGEMLLKDEWQYVEEMLGKKRSECGEGVVQVSM